MSNLEIQIEQNKTNFRPGEEIRGTAQWNYDNAPASLELSLFWRTEGKGTRDVGVVEAINFENPGASGQGTFKFTAPAGPYSFSGKLISIIWALELAATKGKDTIRRDITISPSGQKIVCDGSFPDPLEVKAKRMIYKLMGQIELEHQGQRLSSGGSNL